MEKISKEFIKYGNGGKHRNIVDTLIKEIFIDTGNLRAFQAHQELHAGRVWGFKLEEVLLTGQELYANNKELTYKII